MVSVGFVEILVIFFGIAVIGGLIAAIIAVVRASRTPEVARAQASVGATETATGNPRGAAIAALIALILILPFVALLLGRGGFGSSFPFWPLRELAVPFFLLAMWPVWLIAGLVAVIVGGVQKIRRLEARISALEQHLRDQ